MMHLDSIFFRFSLQLLPLSCLHPLPTSCSFIFKNLLNSVNNGHMHISKDTDYQE